MTVSEFIRESKPDWQHVNKVDKTAGIKPFSGVPVIRMGTLTHSTLQEQIDDFDNRNQVESDDTD